MTNEKYLKMFSNFLKENNAFGKYRNELLREYKDVTSVSPYNIIQILKKKGYNTEKPKSLAYLYIFSAFTWVHTLDGPTFWVDMNSKWKKRLEYHV
jgi:hypothetical protein